VENILIDDDVAVKDSLYTAGRRGVGATVLAEKIVGAAAEAAITWSSAPTWPQGQQLRPQHGHGADLLHRARRRQAHLRDGRRRDGVWHRHPRRAGPEANEDDRYRCRRHHRNAGQGRSSTTCPLVDGQWVDKRAAATASSPWSTAWAARPLIGAVHCLSAPGGTLRSAGITISRNLIGNYVTSLEMAGCRSPCCAVDDELLRWWDAPVHTPRCVGSRRSGHLTSSDYN
jgi:dihydroxyacetone kinase-like protein